MGDRFKSTNTGAKTLKSKRPSMVSAPSSSRAKTAPKEKPPVNRTKRPDQDTTILQKESNLLPDFDAEYSQIAYGRFMRAMLEECLIEEKVEREENEMDLQMAQLAERFQKTIDQLDKTNKRLKDISFVVEQKRLLDLKSKDNMDFFDTTSKSNSETILQDLLNTERSCLDKLELRNVDFGYDQNSGHKQLFDAVTDAIQGLDKIKKESNLDVQKFAEYERSKVNIEEIEKDRLDLESIKSDFQTKFPKFSEQLLLEASEKIAQVIENDDLDNED